MERNVSQLLQDNDNQPSSISTNYAEKIKICYEAIENNHFGIKSITTLNEIYKALSEAK